MVASSRYSSEAFEYRRVEVRFHFSLKQSWSTYYHKACFPFQPYRNAAFYFTVLSVLHASSRSTDMYLIRKSNQLEQAANYN
jgi:hypothetical protein